MLQKSLFDPNASNGGVFLGQSDPLTRLPKPRILTQVRRREFLSEVKRVDFVVESEFGRITPSDDVVSGFSLKMQRECQ